LAVAATSLVLALVCAGTFFFRAGHVFDGVETIGSRMIVVRDSLVAAVLPDTAKTSTGAEVIDDSGTTVMPGLVNVLARLDAMPLRYAEEVERYGTGKAIAQKASGFPDNRLHLLLNGVTLVGATGMSAATPWAVASCRSGSATEQALSASSSTGSRSGRSSAGWYSVTWSSSAPGPPASPCRGSTPGSGSGRASTSGRMKARHWG
jgi:hypothetical protein